MTDPARAIADAVLYEGYILWPYRRSALKNRRRWTFGGVFPPAWSEVHPDDRAVVQAEVAARVVGGRWSVVGHVRFLQVVRRQVLLRGEPVEEAAAGGERYLTWEEAVEREVGVGPFEIPAGAEREDLGDGVAIVRSWERVSGRIDLTTDHRPPTTASIQITNTTPFSEGTRDDVLSKSFCSCHAILRATDGTFISATEFRGRNDGLWPVLIDDHTVLASPIILEDFPSIAPESPGDLFDGGEIDQMLVLNILTLTDEEKDEMRASDPRAREILERTEALSTDELMALHGRLTDLSRVHG